MINPFLVNEQPAVIRDGIVIVHQGMSATLFEGPVLPQVEAGGTKLYVKKHHNDNDEPLLIGTLRTGNVTMNRKPDILYAALQVKLTAEQTKKLARGTYYYTIVHHDVLGDVTMKVTDGNFEVKLDASSKSGQGAIRE